MYGDKSEERCERSFVPCASTPPLLGRVLHLATKTITNLNLRAQHREIPRRDVGQVESRVQMSLHHPGIPSPGVPSESMKLSAPTLGCSPHSHGAITTLILWSSAPRPPAKGVRLKEPFQITAWASPPAR